VIVVVIVLGIVLIVISIAINLFVESRTFYRQSSSGAEGFFSFFNSILGKLSEGTLPLIGKAFKFLGIILLILGCFLYFFINP